MNETQPVLINYIADYRLLTKQLEYIEYIIVGLFYLKAEYPLG